MFDLPANARIIVSSGRLTRDKNQIGIVEAVALMPEAHLAIAGVGPDFEMLRALAAERGIADRVHLVGELDADGVLAFLAAGDVYAFASRHETFGLAAVEAAVAGLPVVANNIAVLREVLTARRGAAALFVDTEDAAAFAAALHRALDDAPMREALTAAGRSLAEQYSPDLMCAQYEILLVNDSRVVEGTADVATP
jgi:glycosyltransferase involved in cell wall biosynthesis